MVRACCDSAVRNRVGLCVCGLCDWQNPAVGGKAMNLATIVVLIMIGAALCAAVFSMIRGRRKGGCGGCSGCCSGCPDGSGCRDFSEREKKI